MPSSVPPNRCPRHNLVVPPNGRCILCRRESSAVAAPAVAESAAPSRRGVFGALLLIAAGAAAAWSASAMRGPAPPPPAASAVPLPQLVAPPEPEAKEVEDDLAASLRMLERAEQERQELERATQEREAQTRAAADAQRKREEAERDKRRHEAVKRDLEATALAAARRNVAITMYSTSWCGACKNARAYMERQHIAFTEYDVEEDAAARTRAHALNPRGSVPTIAVDDEVLVGFSPDSLETRIARAAKRRTGS